ncbi:MAG: MFS transporter [Deltaproteobacteria bacterium]|jgi:MFS transporter, PPP family, 3-phenylpropionic acid transporter|nr:MFS transporter [Deltaproteobacteria bacterium]MBT6436379.1 MFS transporter [Deltaproteobacteria bacterium]MBT6489196.1 MFS transporter [Deltaproteobacteria bacterium]
MTNAPNLKALKHVGLLYFLFLGSHGALLPFMPLFFESRGLTPTDISFLMAILPLSNLIIPPLWGILADSLGSRSRVLRFCLLMYSASVLALVPSLGFWGTLGVMFLFALFRSPVTALTDAVAHAQLGPAIERFGKVRLWGSIGFLVCTRLYGYLYDEIPEATAIGSVSLLILAAAFASRALDAEPASKPPSRRDVFTQTKQYILSPHILILLLGVFIYYSAHSTFDAYFGLHMRSLGFSYDFIGTAWAIGVGTEVLLMTQAHRILKWVSPVRLLAVCGLLATTRWALLSELTGRTEILLSQPLHGVTFGMFYLSMVNQVQKHAPAEIRATVQSAALAFMSMGMIVGYLCGGYVYEALGGQMVFFCAMLVAAVATVVFALAPRFWTRFDALQAAQEANMESNEAAVALRGGNPS